MKGKTLKQVISEIKGYPISNMYAESFARSNFAEVYAWIKHDVLINQSKQK